MTLTRRLAQLIVALHVLTPMIPNGEGATDEEIILRVGGKSLWRVALTLQRCV